MPNIQQALCEPNIGANLTRVQAFLDFLATKLAADDYAEAVSLLFVAVHPPHAARRNREAA